MNKAYEQLDRWLAYEKLDPELRAELLALQAGSKSVESQEKEEALEEINDRFYRELEFGTGGLRGILGAGMNRMNIYTVRKTTMGLAKYIRQQYENPSAAISYDSRINSELFAREAADVFIASGVDVFLYDTLMPAPALSFATRYHGCCVGIMITASHNPSKYNGYKVYNAQGCQVTSQAAEDILQNIKETDAFAEPSLDKKDLHKKAKLTIMGSETKNAYYQAVEAEKMVWAEEEEMRSDLAKLSVAYTPLNGAGNLPVRELLRRIGVEKVHIVTEQELPDGNFPTCPYPNPEKREALDRGLALCREVGPDLLLATDPDCDRVGIAVCHQGEQHLLTGNETGILLLDFICTMRAKMKGAKSMPPNPVAVRTIVSSRMADGVAREHGVTVETTLTGFKYIGEIIGRLEQQGRKDDYIFGFEESYGYLSGAHVRDKDAVNASTLICQMAAWYKKQGKTLLDRLNELYEKHGYYLNHLLEFAFEGERGMQSMLQIMNELRSTPPAQVAGRKVVSLTDYAISDRFPKTDMIEMMLDDGSSFIARPSGTEPKLKIYISAIGKSKREAETAVEKMGAEICHRLGADKN